MDRGLAALPGPGMTAQIDVDPQRFL